MVVLPPGRRAGRRRVVYRTVRAFSATSLASRSTNYDEYDVFVSSNSAWYYFVKVVMLSGLAVQKVMMERAHATLLPMAVEGPHAPSPLNASLQSDHLSFRASLATAVHFSKPRKSAKQLEPASAAALQTRLFQHGPVSTSPQLRAARPPPPHSSPQIRSPPRSSTRLSQVRAMH